MRVAVAVAFPDRQEVIDVELPEGATVAEAIAAARLAEHFPMLAVERLESGIWGKARERSAPLRDGDRVELYRPLQADPKEARRARARLRTSTRARNAP